MSGVGGATITRANELVVCIPEEPQSLYFYQGDHGLAEEHIWQAIYEAPYTTLSFDYQPRGLSQIPSVHNGDLKIHRVEAGEGERIVDRYGDVVQLDYGTVVIDADGEQRVFDGQPIEMLQLAARFKLNPLIWSDGVAVTAADSVYSYELDASADTPSGKRITERTQSYSAVDEFTVEWQGLPGFVDHEVQGRFWMPLPQHLWRDFTPAELLRATTSREPAVGHGPYRLAAWAHGHHITLERNPHYYLAAEGLPKFDRIIFRFIDGPKLLMAELASGRCDVATHDGLATTQIEPLRQAGDQGRLQVQFSPGMAYEQIVFGINSVGTHAVTRPDWFESGDVRLAVAMCIDRERLAAAATHGLSNVMSSYLPTAHPLYAESPGGWIFDQAEANKILDGLGHYDRDDDGIREFVDTERPFEVTLLTVDQSDGRAASSLSLTTELLQSIVVDLKHCGVGTSVKEVAAEHLLANGPRGLVFGRRFELASYPWLASIAPNCESFLSSRIPSQNNEWHLNFNNASGYISEEYDLVCNAARQTVPGTSEYIEAQQQAQIIFARDVPAIPLFQRIKMTAAQPGVVNLRLNVSQPSELWNIAEFDWVSYAP